MPREFARFRTLFGVYSPTNERQESRHQSQRRYIETPDLAESDPKVTSQQQMGRGEGHPSPPIPPSSLELSKNVFQKLANLATKENVSVNQLASEMLKAMLALHHREVRQIIETIKKRAFR
jgi:hypothetical protein